MTIMMKKILILTAVATLLGSCGLYGKYKPQEEVPANLYGEEVVATDSSSLADLSWREMFTDAKLQALIDTALARNVDYRTIQLKVEQAEAAMIPAKLAYLPSIALSPQGGFNYTALNGGVTTQTYTAPATASWEIDFFGKLTNAKRKAKATLEQTRDYEQAVKTQLIAGVATTYYSLLMLDAQLEIAQETEKNWSETVKTARAMKKAGMMNEAGLAQTEATYYNICTTVLTLKESVNEAQNTLCLLLAQTPQYIERGSLSEAVLPENISLGVPVSVLSRRPDVRAAEHELEGAFYDTNKARASFYPQISLSGTAGWTNSIGGAIVNPGEFIGSALLSILQPIFNKGALVANLKIMKANQEIAYLNFQKSILKAGSEVNLALDKYQTAKAKSDFYSKQVNTLEVAANSTKLLMKYGNTTYLEVLTAQTTLLNAQLNQVSNKFVEIQSMIELYRALGGGQD